VEGPGLVANYLRTKEYPNCIEDSNGKLAGRNCLAVFCYANRTLWYYLDTKNNDSSTAELPGIFLPNFVSRNPLSAWFQLDQSLLDWPNMVDCTSLWYSYGLLDTLTHDFSHLKTETPEGWKWDVLDVEHTPLKALNRILNPFSFKKKVCPTIFFEIKEKTHPKMSQKKPPGTFRKERFHTFFVPQMPNESSVHVIQRHHFFQLLRSRPCKLHRQGNGGFGNCKQWGPFFWWFKLPCFGGGLTFKKVKVRKGL